MLSKYSEHNESDDETGNRPGTFHVWFRGESRRLGDMTHHEAAERVQMLVWVWDVDDADPLYLFEGYFLLARWELCHANTGYCMTEHLAHEYRVFNVFDDRGKLIDTVTCHRTRVADELTDELEAD